MIKEIYDILLSTINYFMYVLVENICMRCSKKETFKSECNKKGASRDKRAIKVCYILL